MQRAHRAARQLVQLQVPRIPEEQLAQLRGQAELGVQVLLQRMPNGAAAGDRHLPLHELNRQLLEGHIQQPGRGWGGLGVVGWDARSVLVVEGYAQRQVEHATAGRDPTRRRRQGRGAAGVAWRGGE